MRRWHTARCTGCGAAPGLAGCVLVRDVEFASTSEVDLAPFYGRLHIAYVPGTSGVVLGLSKVARLAKVLARRLTHQAALADAALAAFVAAVRPRGAAVLVEEIQLLLELLERSILVVEVEVVD